MSEQAGIIGRTGGKLGHVQKDKRQMCSVGGNPTEAKVRTSFAWIEGKRETESLESIDKVSKSSGRKESKRKVASKLCLSKTSKCLNRQELYFFPDSYPPMFISLAVLLVALRSVVRARLDLQLENLALRHMHEAAEVQNFGESPA